MRKDRRFLDDVIAAVDVVGFLKLPIDSSVLCKNENF